jgi:hypothetical protein
MPTTRIPLIALALLLLPCAAFAQADYSDCRLTCAAERESRDMNCPSPYGITDGGQERSLCMKDNRDAYNDCLSHCPTPQPVQPSSETPPPPPPPMGY